MTYISNTHACYVCRNITIRAALFMQSLFPPSARASFVYDHFICYVSPMMLGFSKAI